MRSTVLVFFGGTRRVDLELFSFGLETRQALGTLTKKGGGPETDLRSTA
jgi:hypothetical protein